MKVQFSLITLSVILLISTSCDVLNLESGRSGYLNGFNVEEIYPDELTAKLATAAGEGDTQEMDKLISQGADVNATGRSGYSLLVWAFKMESLIGFKHLLAKGTNPDMYFGTTGDDVIISDIILYSEVDYLQAILEVGANPNIMYGFGPTTPLIHIAISEGGKLHLAKLLVSSGADIDFQTH